MTPFLNEECEVLEEDKRAVTPEERRGGGGVQAGWDEIAHRIQEAQKPVRWEATRQHR